eukprot:TRINITY_DN42740_c0_g1_i1.p1 TRINITY_DN42740_c0_g1~~TRINITY_DN42740_c0_g1_i1.p1  ORF type:complete len:420 (-),score=118.79 TRINITY_DN42740_c0_g1_i1:71-1330(-)
MAHDLTRTMAPFMDVHMVLPIFDFHLDRNDFNHKDIKTAKLELLKLTNMVDYTSEVYCELNETSEPPKEFLEHREHILEESEEVKKQCASLLDLFISGEAEELKNDKKFTIEHLKESHDIDEEVVENLYHYAKFKYECGEYDVAADLLENFNHLTTNKDHSFNALWGKIACHVLQEQWDVAIEDLTRIRNYIDSRTNSPIVQLQQRSWVLHWALFIYFKHPQGPNLAIDLFFQSKYLNAIQTTSPHLLRYLIAAVITNMRRRSTLKELVKVVSQEAYNYSDPITEFLIALYADFNFDEALKKLKECDEVLASDFFLHGLRAEFIENARLFVFETYCKIHQAIDIPELAEKLEMEEEDAERWIVNLIRNARLDGKIDASKNCVVMTTPQDSVYQQVIDKTRSLSFRSFVMSNKLSQHSHK